MNSIKRTFGYINKHPLAKNHRLRACKRFLVWQLRSRMFRGPIKIDFIEGTRMWAKKGMVGITGSIYAGLHEFEEMAFLLHFLTDKDIFFDIGANVGAYTILAGGVCRAECFSFEPVQSTFSMLTENVALNHLQQKVTCINAGVGNNQKTLRFNTDQDSTNHVLIDGERSLHTAVIPIVRLDNFKQYRPSLLKIDVEGFETEVLNGAELILNDSNLKAIIIELNGWGQHYGFKDEAINQKLINLGFAPYSYNPHKRKLEKLSSFGNLNTIYVRDLTHVEKKIKEAPQFKVFNECL